MFCNMLYVPPYLMMSIIRSLQVSWLAKTSGSGAINAQYKTTDGKGEGWVNDSNGIPETLAVGFNGAWMKMQDSAKGTHTLSGSMKTMATVSVPSAGTYLVVGWCFAFGLLRCKITQLN